MEVKITNLADDFIKFWEAAKDKSLQERKSLWRSEYEDKNRGIFDHFIEIFESSKNKYVIENHLEECFDIYEKEYNNIKKLRGIDKKIKTLCDKCSDQFNITDINLNFVIMVGLNMANAFATGFNNGTSFYFLEKIGDIKYIDILLVHEITHLFSYSRILDDKFKDTVAISIILEGLAVFNAQCLCPGFKTSEYICIEENKEEWMEECKNVLKDLKQTLLEDLGKTGDVVGKYFYTYNTDNRNIPMRIGYFIGYYVVNDLIKIYELPEIISWDAERIEKEVRASIQRII